MLTLSKEGGARSALPFSVTGGLAGIGFAALILLSNAVLVPAGLPAPGAADAEALDFYGSPPAALPAVLALGPLTWVLSTVFASAALAALWGGGPRGGSGWALVGFAGVLLQNGTFLAVTALRFALADGGVGTPGLWAFQDALFLLNGTFLALALTGFSLGGLRAGLIGRGLGRLGLVAAALHAASATLTPLIRDGDGPLGLLGLTGWLLWTGWLIGYGLALVRRPGDVGARS
ncbi:2-oxoglutarate/malate transporter [Streptomyces carpaticus]|uniref:2-oxoglutarate/malate transporter n=1 Tax=Streptomyces TaxID=1883 RepID=UPI00220E022E|nr:2-oxoglutarate/malate transporter [Streptomyces carpaticus]